MKFTPLTYRIFTTCAVLLFVAAPTVVFAQAADEGGSWVGTILAGFGASIFGLVGVLFDESLRFLVFEIGGHMRTAVGVNVELVWSIVRDLCNLVFIFMFLFLGIRLVLTMESVGNAQKVIARVIIAALLINFSFFASKAIIDVSNVATVAVYNMFGVEPGSGYSTSIGTKFAGQLGMQTWFSGATAETTKNVGSKGFGIGLIMMFFFLLAAVTFLVATIMLIKRYIVLMLGMMFSPLVLLFSIIPKGIPFTGSFSKKADEGFQTFIQSAFFPAVFLFIIYIALQILQSYTLKPNFNNMLADNSSSLPDIIVYCIGIGFLFIAMKSASMVSESVATGAMDLSRKAAGAATLGVAAAVGRNTIGRFSEKYLKGGSGEQLRDAAARGGVGGIAARAALRTLKTAEGGSYEVRGTGAYKKYVAGSDIGKAVGIQADAGYGVKGGGYRKRIDTAIDEELKAQKQTAELLKAGESSEYVKGVAKERDAIKKKVGDAEKDVDDTEVELRDAIVKSKEVPTPENERAVDAARKKLKLAKEVVTGVKKAVEKAEAAVHNAEQYRVIGTKEGQDKVKEAQGAEKEASETRDMLAEEVEQLQGRFVQEPDAQQREALAATIKEKTKKLERQEEFVSFTTKETNEALRTSGGYAGIVQSRGTAQSWVRGTTQTTQEGAGSKLRDAFKKREKKEDKKDEKKEGKKDDKKDEDKH